MKDYLSNPDHDPLSSLEAIYQKDKKQVVKKVTKHMSNLFEPINEQIKNWMETKGKPRQ